METPVSLSTCEQTSGVNAYAGMRLAAARLRLNDIMTRDVVTIDPTESLQNAARLMSENQVSCLPVINDGSFEGILTQKDVLARTCDFQQNDGPATVAHVMRTEVPTVSADTGVLEAGRIMETKRTKWLPVLAAQQLAGIVTQTDIIRAITSLVKVVEVRSIMQTNVVTMDAATTVSAALETMSQHGLSCLVAVHGGKVVGIVTEKDLLRRVCAEDRDPGEVLIADVMSFPVITIQPCYCLFTAHRMMDRMRVHRLVVMDANELCGIITHTDILRSLKETLSLEPAAS
jgi:CBS domain-containing protein